MKQEDLFSLKAIPLQVLNNVIAPLLVKAPLVLDAQKKPLDLMIQYADTGEDRSKLSNGYMLYNFMVFSATYAMPSPHASYMVFLHHLNKNIQGHAKQLQIINRETKDDTLKKAVPLYTTALAINDTGTKVGIVEEKEEQSTMRYTIYLYDPKLDLQHKLDTHTVSKNFVIQKKRPMYKTVAAFSKDNTKLMIQLPFGKIYIYTVVESKTPPSINQLFKQWQVCKELVKKQQ